MSLRLIPRALTILALLANLPAVAHAQEWLIQGYPAGLQVGAGAAVPVGAAAGSSGLGWNVGGGGDLEFRPGLAIRVGYFYGRFAAEEATVVLEAGSATLRGKTQVHVGAVDLVWKRELTDYEATVSLFAGPVIAYRRVTLTGPLGGAVSAESPVSFCEPHWLQCSPTPLPFHRVPGIRRSTDFGASAGAGVSFDVGLRARLFAEARFVFLDGPSFRDASGSTRSARAFYVPVFLGVRFQ
jgi:opacity protein-like surface antigen